MLHLVITSSIPKISIEAMSVYTIFQIILVSHTVILQSVAHARLPGFQILLGTSKKKNFVFLKRKSTLISQEKKRKTVVLLPLNHWFCIIPKDKI